MPDQEVMERYVLAMAEKDARIRELEGALMVHRNMAVKSWRGYMLIEHEKECVFCKALAKSPGSSNHGV